MLRPAEGVSLADFPPLTDKQIRALGYEPTKDGWKPRSQSKPQKAQAPNRSEPQRAEAEDRSDPESVDAKDRSDPHSESAQHRPVINRTPRPQRETRPVRH